MLIGPGFHLELYKNYWIHCIHRSHHIYFWCFSQKTFPVVKVQNSNKITAFFFFYSRKIIEEVSSIAKLKFKYIIPIYGMCSEVTALVMEYMSNGSLNNLLASHTLMWPKKFQMIHETSLGMNFLHSMKPPLLHLNLKTSNILVDDHLHIKVSKLLET